MRKKLVSLLLAGALVLGSLSSAGADEISEEITDIENEAAMTQQQLEDLNASIDDIEGQKAELLSDIDETEAQLVLTLASISALTDQIDIKNQELDQTTKDLEDAEKDEAVQYEGMKKRIQYLYESGGDAGWAVILLEETNLTDFLNRAEYTQQMYDYDRRCLQEYADTVDRVSTLKDRKEKEKTDLERMLVNQEEQQIHLEEQLTQMRSESKDYETKLSRAVETADEYVDLINQQNNMIQELLAEQDRRRLAEEEAARAAEEAAKAAEEAEAAARAAEEEAARAQAEADEEAAREAAEEAERARQEAEEAAERARQEAEEAERARQEAEEAERARQEQEERQRQEEEERQRQEQEEQQQPEEQQPEEQQPEEQQPEEQQPEEQQPEEQQPEEQPEEQFEEEQPEEQQPEEPSYTIPEGYPIVDRAAAWVGRAEYVWGACSPGAFDCSGFVSYCVTGAYARIGTTYTFLGFPQVSDPIPGDICTSETHCGIYIGNGMMIHASDYGVGVIISEVRPGMIYVRY